MKMGNSLINIKNEDIEFYKSVSSRGDYIKFLELLRNMDSKPDVEINTVHKELIENALIRQRSKLSRLLKDKRNLLDHISKIISINKTIRPLLRRFNELASRDEICRIINVSNKRLLKGLDRYLGVGYEKYDEDDDEDNEMFEYLILEEELENEDDSVFFSANCMMDIFSEMGDKIVKKLA